jgi:hypothetical protein
MMLHAGCRALRGIVATIGIGSIVACAGCWGRGPRVAPPKLDPEGIAEEAISTYDANQDGVLSKEELEDCPGIRDSIELYDADSNGSVSAAEIQARAEKWVASRTALTTLPCMVTYRGRSLVGATVRLVPEVFMLDAIKPAEGVVDEFGRALPGIAPEELPEEQRGAGMPLVNVGVYRVMVTHPRVKLPSQYNSETTLGVEVASDNIETMNGVRLDLK